MRSVKQPARVPLALALLGFVLALLGTATIARAPATAADAAQHSG